MRYVNEVIAYCERFCVLVWYELLPPINGMYYARGERSFVVIAKRLELTYTLLKSTIAEELGHHFTTAPGDWAGQVGLAMSYADRIGLSKTELRALKWAADYLIEDAWLEEFAKYFQGVDLVQAVAEEFETTVEIARLKLEMFRMRQREKLRLGSGPGGSGPGGHDRPGCGKPHIQEAPGSSREAAP